MLGTRSLRAHFVDTALRVGSAIEAVQSATAMTRHRPLYKFALPPCNAPTFCENSTDA